ncbi:MAG: 3-dehydro-L-gulonate 2-dehydrogenase [Bacteroidota bacterium]|nr:3-dehydro-L-gulonate 2-dehydrogenase [Bacteroidota bacterium]
MQNSIRIPPDQMKSEFVRILIKNGFNKTRAEKCADIFTTNSLEGVYSHGVNRFPKFIENIHKGYIHPDAEPSLVVAAGALEQWNGNLGPGPLNAVVAAERSMELSKNYGLGMVAIGNTNHWMRGGIYGWMAAKKGYVLIAWTNTEANMPAWGAKDFRIGNNPLVIAIPYGNEAIVLDFAMSQYSYGKLEQYSLEGKRLPYPGGFDRNGTLTDSPDEILATRRALPAGYWKGSGLSLLLDILASILSGGLSTSQISVLGAEYALSQVFIAVGIKQLPNYPGIEKSIVGIIRDLKGSIPVDPDNPVRFPGENTISIREQNRKDGIPVNKQVWRKILAL